MAQPWWEERVPPLSQRELFGAPRKGEGPLPLTGIAPQLQPLEGMLLRRSTDIHPKELARDMRQFFNSLLGVPSRDTAWKRPSAVGTPPLQIFVRRSIVGT